ncbi:hypothetical protein T484DRAFT_1858342 [Baffinella frigidus]|nr:hypothetical protein T484DRAFT_1858342 [Cryptophyta sp. CCMP2293]
MRTGGTVVGCVVVTFGETRTLFPNGNDETAVAAACRHRGAFVVITGVVSFRVIVIAVRTADEAAGALQLEVLRLKVFVEFWQLQVLYFPCSQVLNEVFTIGVQSGQSSRLDCSVAETIRALANRSDADGWRSVETLSKTRWSVLRVSRVGHGGGGVRVARAVCTVVVTWFGGTFPEAVVHWLAGVSLWQWVTATEILALRFRQEQRRPEATARKRRLTESAEAVDPPVGGHD